VGMRLTIMVIGIALLVGLLLLSLPDAEDIPEEKMTSISMAMCLADIKIDIRKKLEQEQAIVAEYQTRCPQLIDELKVSRTGRIEVYNKQKKIRLSFVPVRQDGKVSWTCAGTPVQFVPRACQSGNSHQVN
jgi:hypothetical protein